MAVKRGNFIVNQELKDEGGMWAVWLNQECKLSYENFQFLFICWKMYMIRIDNINEVCKGWKEEGKFSTQQIISDWYSSLAATKSFDSRQCAEFNEI